MPQFFDIYEFLNVVFGAKLFFVLLLVFYNVFAFLIWRQIQLMVKTLPTSLSGALKALAILQIGVALAFLLLVLGIF